jgi:hypothetical protein
VKPHSLESRRRLLDREERRFRNAKLIAFGNGWIVAMGGVLFAFIGAAREGSLPAERLLGILTGVGMAAVGLWSVRRSYTMRLPQWVHLLRCGTEAEIDLPHKDRDLHDSWVDQ